MQNASTTLLESLSGLIQRVTFFNDETGFAVLKFKAKGHCDLVTVVGSLPSANAGESVLDTPRAEDAGRGAVDQQGQHHRRRILFFDKNEARIGIDPE